MKKLVLVFVLTTFFSYTSFSENRFDSELEFEIDDTTSNVEKKNDSKQTNFIVVKKIIYKDDMSCEILHVVKRQDGTEIGSFTVVAPDGHEDCNGVIFHVVPW